MSLKERAYSVLLVSASEQFRDSLLPLLPESACSPVTAVTSVEEAERKRKHRDFDFVFVDSPLPDDAGIRFAIDCCRSGWAVAVVFAAAELYDQVNARAAEHGVFVLPRPVPKGAVLRGLNWMIAARERLRLYEKKLQPIEEAMEEIRLVNRAKWLLIGELKMSEPDAHHYINHQAMNRCVPKRTVAEEIIKLYS